MKLKFSRPLEKNPTQDLSKENNGDGSRTQEEVEDRHHHGKEDEVVTAKPMEDKAISLVFDVENVRDLVTKKILALMMANATRAEKEDIGPMFVGRGNNQN